VKGKNVSSVSESVIQLTNDWWDVEIGISENPGPRRVVDLRNGLVVADENYCYAVNAETYGYHHKSLGVIDTSARREDDSSGQTVVLSGRFDFGKNGPTDIGFRHRITLPADGAWLEEQITLVHLYGPDRHELSGLRFGFRKILFDRDRYDWRDGADQFRLIPVPHRRRFGHSVDRLLGEYSAADLFPQSWDPAKNLPGYGSEAWLWTDRNRGVLVAKYNQQGMEFSLFDGEFVVSEGASLNVMDAVSSHTPIPVHLCARFGGVGLYRGDPECGQSLDGRVEHVFGATRLYAFTGHWEAGYNAYRNHLRGFGHGVPAGFNPPMHWNELYNLGWRLGDNAPFQTRAELETEAGIAADIGAEALYLDPTWDIAEGSTIWDSERLGSQAAFVEQLANEHGLKLSLHLMMHTTKLDEDPRFYHHNQDGSTISFMNHREVIYPNVCVCCASDIWKETKIARLRALADAGATFFMFDFLFYARAGDRISTQCYDPTHGHPVPLTRQQHVDSVFEVIQAVKETHPHVLIEAHDRINGGMQDYHPLYFQHGRPNSFDENWGFEYMWDPYYDLISGQALSLYEYNLAYDIPLYLHIHEGRDSESMLAFWWYASTCRHLGIGGVSDPSNPLYVALKRAVGTYQRLKRFFTQAEFIGIDQFAHFHVIANENAAIGVLFNMSGSTEAREITLSTSRLGLTSIDRVSTGTISRREGGEVTIHVEIPPMSPLLMEINL